jgi:prefoldin subunit 5
MSSEIEALRKEIEDLRSERDALGKSLAEALAEVKRIQQKHLD